MCNCREVLHLQFVKPNMSNCLFDATAAESGSAKDVFLASMRMPRKATSIKNDVLLV